jgi:HEAT repeat protein
MNLATMVVLGFLAGFQDPLPGDEQAEAAVEEFRLAIGRPDAGEDDRVLAIRTLGKVVHPKTLAVLVPILTREPATYRIAAALVLANFGRLEETPDALVKAYRDPANQPQSMRAVRIRILQSLGKLKSISAVGLVNAAILDRDAWIARAAASAAGQIRDISSIDPLIRRLQLLESWEGVRHVPGDDPVPDRVRENPDGKPRDGKGAGDRRGEGGSDGADGKRRTERNLLRPSVDAALESVTGERFSSHEEWARWWNEARKDFRVPR